MVAMLKHKHYGGGRGIGLKSKVVEVPERQVQEVEHKAAKYSPTLPKEHDEETLKELRTAFNMLDRNQDGQVYADDIYDMMMALGQNVEKENIEDFMKTAAKGGDGIRESEFISWMETLDHHNNNINTDDYILRGAFETFDKNKDGFISKVELEEGLILIGEHVSDRTLDLMMYEADKDRDGLISFEDFVYIMG